MSGHRAPHVRYHELKPAPALRPYIRCYWTLDAPATPVEQAPERVLPDGCVEMVLNLDAPFVRSRDDGSIERQPAALLIGPMTRQLSIRPTGEVRLVGIRFRPGGAAPFLIASLGELRDATPDLRDVAAPAVRDLWERLANEPGPSGRIAALDHVLGRRLAACRWAGADDARVRAAVSLVLGGGGGVRVDTVAAMTALGVRQLERRFVQLVGFGPKTLSRLARFQRVVRAIDRNDTPRWSRLALACGYADQAHFAREFREFAGTTPSAFARERHPMSDHFTASDLVDAPRAH